VDEVNPSNIILNSEIDGLDILPSSIDLVGAEIELLNLPKREKMLRKVISQVKDSYDFVLIDCSPSLGLITVNSLTAADSVMIPVQCEYFALEGLGKLLNTIKIIQNRLNPDLEIEGFLLTMYDSRLRLSNQVVDEVKKHFQQMVFETIIQRNIKLGEAPSFGKPAILYDADSKGAISHLNLARELMQKNDKTLIKSVEKIIE
jgi:chromosome partitioning protein